MAPKRIAVVGGGISGLAAAYHLAEARKAGASIQEYLLEAEPRLGGVIRTEQVEGCVVEAGPDSFLTEKKEALDLCERLALVPQLVGSQDLQRRTLILHKGKLVPLPEGFEFMVPTRPLSVLTTPLLSLRDKLGLAAEVFLRPHGVPHDESVASFVRRHFGESMLANVVDPLLTAVYGGDAERLSAPSVLPRLVEVEQQWGSLVRGLRAAARKRRAQGPEVDPPSRPPLFTTLRNGLETLVTALQMNLEEERILCGRTVLAVQARADGGHELALANRDSFQADAVILALPARLAAPILRHRAHTLAETLTEIHYSSSLIVALGYEADKVGELPAGFGFLVSRREPIRIRACTFVGQKFAWRVPPNRILLRCFLGGMGDEAVMELADAEISAIVRGTLKAVLNIGAEPLFERIYRWPKAMAQYTLGHQRRRERIRSQLRPHKGLHLAGNACEGIGIPDCIRSGRLAAEDSLRGLDLRREKP